MSYIDGNTYIEKDLIVHHNSNNEIKNHLHIDFDKLYEISINQQQEIERLNNIINKLEKELKEDYKIWMCNSRSSGKSVKFGIDVCKTHFYNRLQELKGSDKE